MRTLILHIMFIVVLGPWLNAQSVDRQVIGAHGMDAAGNNIQVSSTLGETAVQYYEGTNVIISEGFQQPAADSNVIGDGQLVLYTGFTPNADNINDTWIIDGIERYTENEIRVYNRWGQELWVGLSYDNTTVVWGGENDRSGSVVTDGTYFYILKIPELNETHRGWVQVTR